MRLFILLINRLLYLYIDIVAQLNTIARSGDPILRIIAAEVTNILDDEIQNLIDTLIDTATAVDGVGMAAPQLSHSYRLFVMASRPNSRYPYAPTMEPTAVINPRILSYSKEIVKDWEGCLSVPGIRGKVPRYDRIEVEYCDRNGNLVNQELSGFIARIFQHELDHLDGILFTDRLESDLDRFSEAEYQALISG